MKAGLLYVTLGVSLFSAAAAGESLYTTTDLSGHSVVAERNPGLPLGSWPPGDDSSDADVLLQSFGTHGSVTANKDLRNIWVNAIGHKKFIEDFAPGKPVQLGKYTYEASVRLPGNVVPDVTRTDIPDAVHLMMQLWDGRNALWQGDKFTLEAAMFWQLNPWVAPVGQIKVYTGERYFDNGNNTEVNNLTLVGTGITIAPDLLWHRFELVADYTTRKYVSLTVDGQTADLSAIDLARVEQESWGNEVALVTTTESMSAYPGFDVTGHYQYNLRWTTEFKDLDLAISSYLVNQPAGSAAQSRAYDDAGFDFIKTGAGELVMNLANQYTGTTAIHQGTLTLGASVQNNVAGPLGNAASAVLVGNTDPTSTHNAALLISGPGLAMERPIIVQAGSTGTATLGGVHSSGTATFSGNVTLSKNVILAAANGGTVDFSGVIAGAGGVTKSDDGRVILSGINNYTGNTRVTAGELFINGSVHGSAAAVQSGAFLGGSGAVKSLSNNGTVQPGGVAASGRLLVSGGNYTQTGAGSLQIRVQSGSVYDQLWVTNGSAVLNGNLSISTLGGFAPKAGDRFANVVAASGAISGTFTSLTRSNPTLLWEARYGTTNVDLVVTRDYSNPALGLGPSESQLSQALNAAATTASGDLNAALSIIDTMSSAAEIKAAFNEILPMKLTALGPAGMSGAAIQMQNLQGRLFGATTSIGQSQGGYQPILLAYNGENLLGLLSPRAETPDARWDFFINGSGTIIDQETTSTAPGFGATAQGMTMGSDYQLTEDLAVGMATGYSHTETILAANGGQVLAETIPLWVYQRWRHANWYLHCGGGGALNLYENQRNIQFGGLTRTARSQPSGGQANAFFKSGHDFQIGRFTLGPVGSLEYTKLWIDAFTETGADSLNLRLSSQTTESLQGGLGGRLIYHWQLGNIKLLPQAQLSFQHEFANDSRSIEARLAEGSAPFSVSTTAPDRDFGILSGGIEVEVTESLRFSLDYQTEAGRQNFTSHSINGTVHVRF